MARNALKRRCNYVTFVAHGSRWVMASKMSMDVLLEWGDALKAARSEKEFDALCGLFPGIVEDIYE